MFRCFKRGLPLENATAGRAPPRQRANFIRNDLVSGTEGAENESRTCLTRFAEGADSSVWHCFAGSVVSSVVHRSFRHARQRPAPADFEPHSLRAQPCVLAALVIFRDPSPLSDNSARMTTSFAGYSPVFSSPSEVILAPEVFGNVHNRFVAGCSPGPSRPIVSQHRFPGDPTTTSGFVAGSLP